MAVFVILRSIFTHTPAPKELTLAHSGTCWCTNTDRRMTKAAMCYWRYSSLDWSWSILAWNGKLACSALRMFNGQFAHVAQMLVFAVVKSGPTATPCMMFLINQTTTSDKRLVRVCVQSWGDWKHLYPRKYPLSYGKHRQPYLKKHIQRFCNSSLNCRDFMHFMCYCVRACHLQIT
mgnify:CR=1 FL=1